MSEFHDNGMTKQENYVIAKRWVNQEFDRQLEKKPFFVSKRSIQDARKTALDQVEACFYGNRAGGGFAME